MIDQDISTAETLSLLSRRRFLQAIGATGAGLAVTTSWPLADAYAGTAISPTDGILVVITLGGGNDGLNTVVPASNGAYYDNRQGLAIRAEQTLPITDGYGLHPSLGFVKSMFDNGQVAVVEGLGIRENSLSHFDSTAMWMRGVPGVNGVPSGWLGRWLDATTSQPLTAVNIGHNVPLSLVGTSKSGSAISTFPANFGAQTDLWETQLYDAVRSMGAAPTGLGPWANMAAAVQTSALDVGRDVTPIFGTALPNGKFIKELTLAARLIELNVGTRVISVIEGDFDHHASQPAAHATLLQQLDQGLRAFFAGLSPANANRTTVLVVSEFGRTPKGNAGNGTDHGTANNVLLLGTRVKGGLHGTLPSFGDLDSDRRTKPTMDFRAVYAAVFDQWLAGDSKQLLGGTFGGLSLFNSAPSTATPPDLPPTSPGRFIGIVPERRLDTRDGTGAIRAKVGAQQAISLAVGGVGSVPPNDVTSVVLNVTVTDPASSGFITVWPTGEPRPWASHLNYEAGQTVPNLVLSKMGAGGRVNIYSEGGPVSLIADVVGYYSTKGGAALVPLPPSRLLDTRIGGVPLGPNGVYDLPVTGVGGVPVFGPSAVVLNVTVTQPTAGGFVTVWPTGAGRPGTSLLNFQPGNTVPNLVLAKVGANGRVSIFNSSGNTHIIVDVMGYFVPDGASGQVVVANPVRLLDTRNTGGPLASTEVRPLVVTVGSVPPTAKAVVLNVTVTQPTGGGYLTVFPNGVARPTASNLNFVAGQTVPNQVIAAVGTGGAINLFNYGGRTHVIVDLMGWYV